MSKWLEDIRSLATLVRPYPHSMREIPCAPHGEISGRAFYPGGAGAYDTRCELNPAPDIMVVGNDFGTFDGDYVTAARDGEEALAGTWAGAISVLSRSGIDFSRVFFTNAIMGARAAGPNRGPSPGLNDAGFVSRCTEHLRQQIRTLRPSGVVMLGKEQASVVAAALPDLAALSRCTTWREVDAVGMQYRERVSVPQGDFVRFCALMHPCMRASNIAQHGRRFENYRDDEAELEMLRRLARSPI